MQVELNDIQAECLEEYSAATGKPVASCLFEAVDDWIRTVAAALVRNEIVNVEVISLSS